MIRGGEWAGAGQGRGMGPDRQTYGGLIIGAGVSPLRKRSTGRMATDTGPVRSGP